MTMGLVFPVLLSRDQKRGHEFELFGQVGVKDVPHFLGIVPEGSGYAVGAKSRYVKVAVPNKSRMGLLK